ncbi:MAG: 1-phosphofructokinase [Spiroplasma sp.]|nr:1-phosphofructokinase [Spiroplasma sp.]
MIYTLTLNPAIDQMISVKNFTLTATNKAVDQYQILGGKGVNVSVMLKHLGVNNIALGFIGKDNQQQFEDYLKEQTIKSDFLVVKGQVRVNLKIKDLVNNQETELNCLGFSLNKDDEKTILNWLKKKLKKDDFLIISGSTPMGTSTTLYQKIAGVCAKQKIAFAIDATKANLLPTLQYRPLLIKPNLAELNEIFNTDYQFDNQKAVIQLGQKLLAQGAQNVLISHGKEGSILVTSKGSYYANSASGKLVNSVGAGDSMVAGFIGSYLKTDDPKTSLQIATAAGGATAFSQGIGDLALVNKLKSQIKIKVIS